MINIESILVKKDRLTLEYRKDKGENIFGVRIGKCMIDFCFSGDNQIDLFITEEQLIQISQKNNLLSFFCADNKSLKFNNSSSCEMIAQISENEYLFYSCTESGITFFKNKKGTIKYCSVKKSQDSMITLNFKTFEPIDRFYKTGNIGESNCFYFDYNEIIESENLNERSYSIILNKKLLESLVAQKGGIIHGESLYGGKRQVFPLSSFEQKKDPILFDENIGNYKVLIHFVGNKLAILVEKRVNLEKIIIDDELIKIKVNVFYNQARLVMKNRKTKNEIFSDLTECDNKFIFDMDIPEGIWNYYIDYIDDKGVVKRQRLQGILGSTLPLISYPIVGENKTTVCKVYTTLDGYLCCANTDELTNSFVDDVATDAKSVQIHIRMLDANLLPGKYILQHRKHKIRYEGQIINSDKYGHYVVFCTEGNSFANYKGVWDLYFITQRQKRMIRIKTANRPNEILLEKLLFIEENMLINFRVYSTNDEQISLYLGDIHTRVTSITINEKRAMSIEVVVPLLGTPMKDGLISSMELVSYDGTSSSKVYSEFIDIHVDETSNQVKIRFCDISDISTGEVLILLKNVSENTSYIPVSNFLEKYISEEYYSFPHFKIASEKLIRFYFVQNILNVEVTNGVSFVIDDFVDNKLLIQGNNFSKENEYLLGIRIGDVWHSITDFVEFCDNKMVFHLVSSISKIDNFEIDRDFLIEIRENKKNTHNYYHIDFLKLQSSIKGQFSIDINNESYCIKFLRRSMKLKVKLSKDWPWKYLIKLKFAKMLAKILPKKVWLIGENLGKSYQDNGYAFYRKAKENNIPDKFMFVYDPEYIPDSVEITRNMVKMDSLRHLIAYFSSELLIVSHGIRDVLPGYYHDKMSQNNVGIYYLQHGVTAMKRLGFTGNSYSGNIRKLVVSSKNEKNIFQEKMMFDEKQLTVTGMVRYDYLTDLKKEQNQKIVFVMPTWREWIQETDGAFENSEFNRQYQRLLYDKKLNHLLKESGILMMVLPHIEIRLKYGHLFNSNQSNIVIVDTKKESIAELIRKSDMLITDYSSVAFDFAYLGKKVIFFQFDIDQYLHHRGSYINMYEDLFGPVVYDYNGLISEIDSSIRNNLINEEIYQVNVKKYFEFRDKDNFKRNYETILQLLKEGEK